MRNIQASGDRTRNEAEWCLLQVTAVAYDNPIPGFNTSNTINLRLWAAKPDTEFDLEAFNTGDYVQVGPPLLNHPSQSCFRAAVEACAGELCHDCIHVALFCLVHKDHCAKHR